MESSLKNGIKNMDDLWRNNELCTKERNIMHTEDKISILFLEKGLEILIYLSRSLGKIDIPNTTKHRWLKKDSKLWLIQYLLYSS